MYSEWSTAQSDRNVGNFQSSRQCRIGRRGTERGVARGVDSGAMDVQLADGGTSAVVAANDEDEQELNGWILHHRRISLAGDFCAGGHDDEVSIREQRDVQRGEVCRLCDGGVRGRTRV